MASHIIQSITCSWAFTTLIGCDLFSVLLPYGILGPVLTPKSLHSFHISTLVSSQYNRDRNLSVFYLLKCLIFPYLYCFALYIYLAHFVSMAVLLLCCLLGNGLLQGDKIWIL